LNRLYVNKFDELSAYLIQSTVITML